MGTLATWRLVPGSDKTHHVELSTCRVMGFYENPGLV